MKKAWLIEGIIICAIVVWLGSVLDKGHDMNQHQEQPSTELHEIPVA